MMAMTRQQLHDKFLRDNYDIVPKKATSVETRDERTTGPSMPLFGRNASVKLATPRERGTHDQAPLLTGNDPPPRRSSLGTVFTALGEVLRSAGVDPVEALQSGRNHVLGEFEEPQELMEYDVDGELAHTFTAAAQDAVARFRRARDQERGCDLPPVEGSRLDGRTKDGRSMGHHRSYLPGTNSGISTADYAEGLRKERAKMATQDHSGVVAKPVMNAAEAAALRAAVRASWATGG